jgi:hypothetical protein
VGVKVAGMPPRGLVTCGDAEEVLSGVMLIESLHVVGSASMQAPILYARVHARVSEWSSCF